MESTSARFATEFLLAPMLCTLTSDECTEKRLERKEKGIKELYLVMFVARHTHSKAIYDGTCAKCTSNEVSQMKMNT